MPVQAHVCNVGDDVVGRVKFGPAPPQSRPRKVGFYRVCLTGSAQVVLFHFALATASFLVGTGHDMLLTYTRAKVVDCLLSLPDQAAYMPSLYNDGLPQFPLVYTTGQRE